MALLRPCQVLRLGAARATGGFPLKRIALLAVIGAGLLALPGTASARTDCTYAGQQNTSSEYVTVWVSPDADGGVTGDGLAGACADGVNQGGIDGGYVEVGVGDGAGDNGGAYAVIDGSDSNTAGAGQSAGYGALSDYETGATDDPDDDCNGLDEDNTAGGHDGPDSNSGGCLWSKDANDGAEVPLISCGLTSGPDYTASNRDGCSI